MPTTEPTWGWPVAAGADPVKQYPAAVDQPFKAQLAGQMSGTGWRNISASLINGWTTAAANGRLYLRRVGVVVTLVANIKPPAVWVNQAVGPAPTGFAPSTQMAGFEGHSVFLESGRLAAVSAFTTPANMIVLIPSGFGDTAEGAVALLQTIDWITDAPWPATLPGSPA